MVERVDVELSRDLGRDLGREQRNAGRAIALAWTVFGLAAAVLLLYLLSGVLLLVFAGVLLGCGLRGVSIGLARRTPLSAGWALALVCLAIIGVLAAFVTWVSPRFAAEATQLASQLQQQWIAVQTRLRGIDWLQPVLESVSSQDNFDAKAWAARAMTAASSTVGIIGTLVIVLFTALYLAASPALYLEGTVRLVPIARRARARQVLIALGTTLRLWLLGQLIDMAVVGLLVFAGLFAIGVPLASSLALLAGLLNFVPYIGAVAGAVPALLIAFGQGPAEAVWTAVLFGVVQSAEGYLISPFIQRRTVDLPPVVTILSQSVFGALFGFTGLVLAAPLAAVTLVATRKLYVADVLGDREADR